MRYYGTS